MPADTVDALAEAAALEAWERGEDASPVERALLLLSLAGVGDRATLARLPLSHRDRSISALHAASFGPRVTGVTTCPSCREKLDVELRLTDLNWPEPVGDEVVVEAEGIAVRARLADSLDHAYLLRFSENETAEAAAALFSRCVVAAQEGGRSVDAAALTPGVRAAVASALEATDPGANAGLLLTCGECAASWECAFDPGEFAWCHTMAAARRALRDVHTLATAYGWTEAEVLATAAGRRRAYLELVAGSDHG